MLAIAFPMIDPVLVAIGPLEIRWYALAYIVGLVIGWRYMMWMGRQKDALIKPQDADDFLVWAVFGVILGGRLGYVLFYKPDFYFANPEQIVQTWNGGMSFHGGLLGVLIVTWLFCRRRELSFLGFVDLVCVAAPIGLFFGRIANFINSELWGRITDVPWGVVFPNGGPYPRHPSQLYEAALEGLVLAVIMHLVWRKAEWRAKPGTLAGVFLIGYGTARIIVEFYRQPDAFLGFLWGGATMGQLLSIPMVLLGISVIAYSRKSST